MRYTFILSQLLPVVLTPTETELQTTFPVLNTLLEHSFKDHHLQEAAAALGIVLRKKIPILNKPIIDRLDSGAEVFFDFTEKDREIFWDIYNEKIA